jgi:hypothetical protein
VTRHCACALFAMLLAAGCATQGTAPSDSRCPDDGSSSIGFSVGGLGLSLGEPALKAAFASIRNYFSQRPAGVPADKAKAADLAAEAAAEASPQPMNEERKRALRSQADQWVETYTEKCRPHI